MLSASRSFGREEPMVDFTTSAVHNLGISSPGIPQAEGVTANRLAFYNYAFCSLQF